LSGNDEETEFLVASGDRNGQRVGDSLVCVDVSKCLDGKASVAKRILHDGR